MTDSPTLVYDGDCGFCTEAALYIAECANVQLIPFSSVPADLVERLPEDWRECAHFVTEDSIYSCGEAMERAYELTDGPFSWLTEYLRCIPGYGILREGVYSWIAENRTLVSKITGFIFK